MSKASNSGGNQTVKIILIVVGSFFVVGICCIGGLVALLLPAVQQARMAANKAAVMNGMKETGLYLYGTAGQGGIPPLYNNSGTGPVDIPWRIAILETDLANRSIFSSYDKNQKWNSASNQSATNKRPRYFGVNYRGSTPLGPRETHIFRVKLPASQQPKKFRDISDGTSKTVAFVFLPNKTCDWASNVDATPNEIYKSIQNSTSDQPVIFGFYDGSVRIMPPSLSRTDFDAMITPAGGEIANIPSVF